MYNPLNQSDDEISIIKEKNIKEELEEIYKDDLFKLKYASNCGIVAKGLKETLRAIRSFRAKVVYLAEDCEKNDYKKILDEFCDLYKIKKVEIRDWKEIRDNVMNCISSSFIIENARKIGKIPKITPKCYCAAIIEYGDIDKIIQENKKK